MKLSEVLVVVKNLKKYFPLKRGFFSRTYVRAVDDISFEIKRGEIFCLAGESGCGKTTTGRLLLRLIKPTSGKIFFEGEDLMKLKGNDLKNFRRKAQIIFQDPFESLNPREKVIDAITKPLEIHKIIKDKNDKIEYAHNLLRSVDLTPTEYFLEKYPHQLSGGQRQRVAIARAISLKPKFIVADEPVSMLDLSIRAGILRLLIDLKEKLKLTYLFITHDLGVAWHIADRIAIMYLGEIVELGSVKEVLSTPLHPYTQLLISSVPNPRNPFTTNIDIEHFAQIEIPSAVNPPSGCKFHNRCPKKVMKCTMERPILKEQAPNHFVSCHMYS
ncbi:MAG: ABC transporter ATP-binding protein [Candidatus Methanomethylicia archaeon]